MKSLKACVRAVWQLSRPVRFRVAVTIVTGFVGTALSLLFIALSKLLVDIVTGASDKDLQTAVWAFVAVLLLQIATLIFNNWWNSYNLVKCQNILRLQLFGHVLKSRWDGRERFLSGDTVNRLEEDIRVVSDLICERIPGLAVSILQLLAASAYMLYMAPSLLWVLVILMGAAVFGSKLFFRQLRELMARIRARESELQQLMQESLLHRVLVLTLTRVERVLEKFGWMQADVELNTRKRLNYNAVARGLMFLGFQAGHAAAFLWSIFGIRAGTVSFGDMTAFLQLVSRVQRPIAEFGRLVPAFIQGLTSVERLIDLQELPQEPLRKTVQLSGAPEIVVEHLSFNYSGDEKPVIRDLSCRFPAGSFTAIAGPTGIGKSTLIRLILGLLKPTEGSVLIDGHPAGSALRENFMYIPQGNSLLSGTVRSNLQLAAPLATEEQMREALDTAMAQFVFSLPEGLDTPCGEVGSGLSEGQAQRIAIARALLRSGGVLILDESTSALDPATEKSLLQNLKDHYHGRKTILFISHRESVTEAADNTVEIK